MHAGCCHASCALPSTRAPCISTPHRSLPCQKRARAGAGLQYASAQGGWCALATSLYCIQHLAQPTQATGWERGPGSPGSWLLQCRLHRLWQAGCHRHPTMGVLPTHAQPSFVHLKGVCTSCRSVMSGFLAQGLLVLALKILPCWFGQLSTGLGYGQRQAILANPGEMPWCHAGRLNIWTCQGVSCSQLELKACAC